MKILVQHGLVEGRQVASPTPLQKEREMDLKVIAYYDR